MSQLPGSLHGGISETNVRVVKLRRMTDEGINYMSPGLSGRDNDGHEAKVQGEPSSIHHLSP